MTFFFFFEGEMIMAHGEVPPKRSVRSRQALLLSLGGHRRAPADGSLIAKAAAIMVQIEHQEAEQAERHYTWTALCAVKYTLRKFTPR